MAVAEGTSSSFRPLTLRKKCTTTIFTPSRVANFNSKECCEQALEFRSFEESLISYSPENAMVANQTREIQPSGMTQEACGSVGHGSRIEAYVKICGFATET